MVRILKVKELEERKRLLLTQSEMYRQTMRLEVANVKYSVALLKRKFNFLKSSYRTLGAFAPLLGLFFGRKKAEKKAEGGSFFSKLLAGLRMFSQLRPILQGFAAGKRAARESRERENITQFP